jgi:hypothetical protein
MKSNTFPMAKQAGRVSLITIIAAVAVLVCLGIVMFSGQAGGPETTATKFMSALVEADSKKLAKLTYIDGLDEAGVEAKWEANLKLTKYVQFRWSLDGIEAPSPETVNAKIQMQRAGATESTLFRIPLIKDKGEWKVDVAATNRGFYPALPR